MKEVRYSAVGSSSSASSSSSAEVADGVAEVAGNVITKFWNPKLPHHFNAGLVSVGIVSLMIVMQIRDSLNNGLLDDFKRMIHPVNPPEEVEMPQHWNHSSYEFLPVISDWDEQRVRWIEGDPNLKVQPGARPKVLMVTGSSQEEGELYILSHLLLRAGKNKQDYSQMHDIELHYNMINPDPEFSDWWVKLPVIRMLMLRHPEMEWIWWLDADQVITDMTFEPSFAKLDQFNLVLYGESQRIRHGNWDPNSLDPKLVSTGNVMIRNCQWSLDFLGAWASKGTQNTREEARGGEFQEMTEANENVDFVSGDDHASLVVLLAEDMRHPLVEQKWAPNVKLVEETEYTLNGDWTHIAPRLEELGQDTDHRVPFITHFDGCLPHPAEVPKLARRDSENFLACIEQLQRTFDFAENQVYKELGLERNTIGNSSAPFVWKDTPADESAETLRILPIVTGWDEKRKAYLDSKPWTWRNRAVILSGSKPTPCLEKEGAHVLVRGLKNKIDYSRKHGHRMFYNMAIIHKNLKGWWTKLPALKLMMINSVDVEWIWWIDSDAVFTRMDFDPPFERYNAHGYNLIMYGNEHDVYDLKKFNGINTGDMFIRNCQWSLDLLDKWATLADTKVDFLDDFLDRPKFSTDDQSILVYLLITEREKWASKVFFENDGTVVMSGDWSYWTDLYVDEYKMRPDHRPAVTHFAGCHPCNTVVGIGSNMCLERYDRTYNFADNQVLEMYGLRHERLNSSHIVGGFVDDQREWTHLEIERLIGKSPEELSPAAKEEEATANSKEEKHLDTINQEEIATANSREEEQLDTTNKEEEATAKSNEEEQLDTTKEEEVASSSTEEEKLDTTNEEEGTTSSTEDEKLDKTNEEEGTTSSTEEENLDTTKEEGTTSSKEEEDTTNEHEEVPQTEEEAKPEEKEKEDPSVEKPADSELGDEIPANEEAAKDVEVEANEEAREEDRTDDPSVEKPADSELGDEIPANEEAPQDVEVETNEEEKVDRTDDPSPEKPVDSELGDEIPANEEEPKDPEVETNEEEKVDKTEESEVSKETAEETVARDPEEESNSSQEEQEYPFEEEPLENLSTPASNDESSRVTDP